MNKASLFLLISILPFIFPAKVDDLFDGKYTKDIYAGYLKTDVEGNELFYMFTPSQSSTPQSDPVLLWLNGGPGCSSVWGMLGEVGPMTTDLFSGEFTYNKYSWNMHANLIAIEAPAGVGFAKSANLQQSFDDPKTAQGTLTALLNFFKEFPEYAGNDFYISGESYAGVYIPYLTQAIIAEGTIKMKGILIGNGLTDFETDVERSMVEFGYWHATIGVQTWNAFQRNCPHLEPESNDFRPRNVTKRCNEIRRQISQELTGLDPYGIYRECPYGILYQNGDEHKTQQSVMRDTLTRLRNEFKMKYADDSAPQVNAEEELEPEVDIWPPLCDDDLTVYDFLNNATIKSKLGVDPSVTWEQCSGPVGDNYVMADSLDFYRTFINEHPDLRVWFFSGENDAVLPTIGTFRWMDKLGLAVKTEFRQWHFFNQVGGHVQEYENGLTLVTVKGAGHMVPQDQRESSYVMVSAFLNGTLPE